MISNRSKVIQQRVIVVTAGILLAYATFYGHSITSQRIEAIEEGQIVRTIVSRVSSKRTLKTVYVKIEGLERDAGDPMSGCTAGDSIRVYYIPTSPYVVPVGRETFTSMLVFQSLCLATSVLLLGFAVFYPRRKILRYIERQNNRQGIRKEV